MAMALCCMPRPLLHVLVETVLSMYAPGRTTDTVMDSGDGVSHTVPFYRGYVPPHSVLRFELARRDLTKNLMKFATEQECPLATTAEREIAQDIDGKRCYTELKSTAEINKDKTYELPDGNIILMAPNVSVARKYFSIHVPLVKKPADSTTLLSRAI